MSVPYIFSYRGGSGFLTTNLYQRKTYNDETDIIWQPSCNPLGEFLTRKLTEAGDAYDAFSSIIAGLFKATRASCLRAAPVDRLGLGLRRTRATGNNLRASGLARRKGIDNVTHDDTCSQGAVS